MVQRYKITLSPAGDTDPPSNAYYTVDNILPINPPAELAPQNITVWDFLTEAQITDVRDRTNLLDVSAGIQQAIDYVAGYGGARPLGTLYFPAGSYRIETTLIVNLPIVLVGAGEGSGAYPPYSPPATTLQWYGGADEMLIFGGNGNAGFAAGGIVGMNFDARQIATECLRVIDSNRSTFSNLTLDNATERILCILGSAALSFPCIFNVFTNIFVFAGRTGTNIAAGLYVGSDIGPHVANGADGVASCTFISCNFGADQGPGVNITDRGDNFLWLRCSTGSRSGAVNPGTWFSGDPATAVISNHVWINHTGDYRFDKGMGVGQCIIDLNCADISDPSFADPRNMISGAGATEVTGTSNIGFMWGQNKTLGYRESICHDAMRFMRWDSANSLLHTAQGTWGTTVDTSGAVAGSNQWGGAVLLTTDVNANDSTAIHNTAVVGSGGINPFFYPNLVFSAAPISTADVIVRIGWMDSLTDPPTNGIYCEIDTSQTWAGWRFVCRDVSGETVVNSTYAYNLADVAYMFRIELSNNPIAAANFRARTYAFQFWNEATITTNVPPVSTDMSFVCQIITTTTAAKSIYFCDLKLGHNTEEATR